MSNFHIIFEKLRLRFWVFPTATVFLITLLYGVVLYIPNPEGSTFLDHIIPSHYAAAGARLILSSSATALMTVVGVLFSITVVVLQQVSTQYSPRSIESFIRSWQSQIVLGMYVGTFTYCVLMLGQVREDTIPQIGMVVGLFLVMLCIGLLIHYIHHIVHAIQSTAIIDEIRSETMSHLKKFSGFIDEVGSAEETLSLTNVFKIKSSEFGYLQGFNRSSTEDIDNRNRILIKMTVAIGDHLDVGQVVAEVYSAQPLDEESQNTISGMFSFGTYRTHAQDFRYGLRQLVDIALRALSPGINDPSTAREAMYAVASILSYYTSHCHWKPQLKLSHHVSLLQRSLSYNELLELCFLEVMHSAKGQPLVLRIIKETLAHLEILNESWPDRAAQVARYVESANSLHDRCLDI